MAELIESEALRLRSRLSNLDDQSSSIPLVRDKHVHIKTLLRLWRHLTLETEECLAEHGYYTLPDVGPWGGFNFVFENGRLHSHALCQTDIGHGRPSLTPLGRALSSSNTCSRLTMPLCKRRVSGSPMSGNSSFLKQDPSGRLFEISGTHYCPSHTYDHRTFIKVRVSRALETVEEITLRGFSRLLERLHFTN